MKRHAASKAAAASRSRPLIAFFDYPDVFEDFYPHYGVSQKDFATRWADSGNHAFLGLLQREIGDVVWYSFSIAPELSEAKHAVIGCRVRFLQSSLVHRWMWHVFYGSRMAWRWQSAYRTFATLASYMALLSWPFFHMLRLEHPDFLFVQDYASGRFDVLLLFAKILGIPLIAYHAGSRPDRYLGRLAKKFTIPRADKLIASSSSELHMLASRYNVDPRRLAVILTPIDTTIFRPLDREIACQTIGLNPDRHYLLFVGRLDDKVKRVSLLIDAFGAMADTYQNVDLLIVGEGRDSERLKMLALERAPERIHWFGWVTSGADLVPFYNVADCLLLPSVREGFPTVIGEAMGCSTPVLASRVGGVSELVIEAETGWTFPVHDLDMFNDRLAFVMANADATVSMRAKARVQAVRRVSPEAVALALRECFSTEGCQRG